MANKHNEGWPIPDIEEPEYLLLVTDEPRVSWGYWLFVIVAAALIALLLGALFGALFNGSIYFDSKL